MLKSKYVHTNLIAEDWKRLASFYKEVFGCKPVANRPGFGHITFAVDDVEEAVNAVLNAGGKSLGKVSTLDVPDAGSVTFVYLTDPEGNIIELQKWERK